MRVLHVTTRHRRGGAEQNLLHWMQCERERGFEVELVCGADSDPSDVPAEIPTEVIGSLTRAPSPRLDLRGLRQLRELVKKGDYDVVHTHQSKAGVLGRMAAKGKAKRIVHTVHMPSFGPGYRTPSSQVFLASERYCGRFTDQYVCVGNDVIQQYADSRVAARERFFTVRTPIDMDRFIAVRALTSAERHDRRRRLGLPHGVAIAATIGSLEPRKRQNLVIRELAPLLRAGDIELAVAGAGAEEGALRRHSESLGVADHVHFLGHVDRAEDLLSVVHVVVHSSSIEGVCRVFVEATAAGVPVVATDVQGAREVPQVMIVRRDGSGMRDAVLGTLEQDPKPVDPDALHEWTPAAVSARFDQFQERLNLDV